MAKAGDFIETLLQVTGDVSSTLRSAKEETDKGYMIRINQIIDTETGGVPNYKRYTLDSDLTNVQANLMNIEDEINKHGSSTLQQYYKSIVDDVKQSKEDNSQFYIRKEKFSNVDEDNPGLEQKILNEVEKYMTLQSEFGGTAVPEEEVSLAVKNIQDLLFDYGREKDGFIQYYGERVTKDPELLASLTTVDTYAKFILQELTLPESGRPGYIDEATFHTFKEGLFEGNLAALEEHISAQTKGRAAQIQTLIENMGNNYVEMSGLESQMLSRYGEGSEGFLAWAKRNGISIKTKDETQVAREEWLREKAQFGNSYINPILTKLETDDTGYRKLTGYSYLSGLRGEEDTLATEKLVLPPALGANIKQASRHKSFKRFGKSSLSGVYSSIVNEIDSMTKRGVDWTKDEKVVASLKAFDLQYKLLNNLFASNKKAKEAGFKNLKDVKAFKNIDIGKIKSYIKQISKK